MSKQPLKMTMQIPCSSEFVGIVRLAISGAASRMNYSIEEIEDIKISISEACTNAIQHAYGDNANPDTDFIDITVYMFENKLEIVIQDYGNGFDTSMLGTEEQKRKSHEKMGLGLGLTFIKSLMDETTLSSELGKGTTIRMAKSAPLPTPV
jgi:serine/threonine-protein kinase RsbW